jgi:signal transduction histidine kinase/putative methionine-R-sulfoxide reductase with GAF domain
MARPVRERDDLEVRATPEEEVRRLQSLVARRTRELEILSAVAARIHAAEDAQEVLDICLAEILGGLGLQAGWILLGSQHDRKLRMAAAQGVAAAYLEGVRRDGLSECLCKDVFSTGHTMQARNTTDCPRMPSIMKGLSAPVAHACIPLRMHGASVRGVLNVAARPHQPFDEDELRFLETLGHQLCIAIERTEHRQAEQARNQEARAMATINKAIGGSLDVDAVLAAVGQSALELLVADRVQIHLGEDPRKLTVAQLAGLPHPELKQGQQLDLEAVQAQMQTHAFAERRLIKIDDWARDERVNRQLAERWGVGAAIAVPLLARDRALGLLVVTRVAPHRWTEEQLEAAEALAAQASVAIENARLYAEARRAYQDLKEAQQRLLQNERMALLGTFASGLAHEVRNPLNSIALQLSLLERRIASIEPRLMDKLAELVGVIREEIRRLDALVGDFLFFSRTSRIQLQLTDLDALVDEVTRLLRPEARASGVTLRRKRAGAATPALLADPEKLKQVVINLVQNAIEAMPDGGVVVLESGLREGRALVTVRDNGPGLPERLDVFQLFVTTKAKGTGLGLSIAQQIVLAHGGEISAESEPGKGASFTVALPIGPAEPDPDEKGP